VSQQKDVSAEWQEGDVWANRPSVQLSGISGIHSDHVLGLVCSRCLSCPMHNPV